MGQDKWYVKKSFEWAEFTLVQIFHFINGALCIPAVFGLLKDKKLASALVCLGCSGETGWELSHLMTIFYRKYFEKNGHLDYSTV